MADRPSNFDLDRIRESAFLAEVEWHATLGSTNDRAIELTSRTNLATPLLILADEQTAGRGRGTNRWWSQAGALTFSLILEPERLDPPLRTEHWPRVALLAGAALCGALEGLFPGLECLLKWPNDVLVHEKKLAGILVEVPPTPVGVPRRLVLGMGVNVNNSLAGAPLEVAARAVALRDIVGSAIDVAEILTAWLNDLSVVLQRLAVADEELPAYWQSRSALTGRTIELQAADQLTRGTCHGIADDGALLLETEKGIERIYGGAVVRVSD